MSSSKRVLASVSTTSPPLSALLPTTTHGNLLCASIPSTGHLSTNSPHQRFRSCSVSGRVTSYTKMAASLPRKKADESDAKRSWPAVSQQASETSCEGEMGIRAVTKSQPMVALYEVEKRPVKYMFRRLVLPAPVAPMRATFTRVVRCLGSEGRRPSASCGEGQLLSETDGARATDLMVLAVHTKFFLGRVVSDRPRRDATGRNGLEMSSASDAQGPGRGEEEVDGRMSF